MAPHWKRRQFLWTIGAAAGYPLVEALAQSFRASSAAPLRPPRATRLAAISHGCCPASDLPETPCFDVLGYASFEKDGRPLYYRCGGSGGGRGINVAVLNEVTGNVEGVENFDTWDSNGQNMIPVQALIAYLDEVESGRVVLLAIGDDGGFIDFRTNKAYTHDWIEDGYRALEELGSRHIREVGYRGSWAMFAQKGAGALGEAFGTGEQVVQVSFDFRASGFPRRPPPIQGVNYGPFRDGQRPGGLCPTIHQVTRDLPVLQNMATAIRTFGLVDCDLGEKILSSIRARRRAHLQVALGLWISADRDANEREIEKLEALARAGLLGPVITIVVGNEVVLRGDLSPAELRDYIEQVRALGLGIPLTTAEPWSIWVGPGGTELASACDLVFANIYPYWERICIEDAVDFVFERYSAVRLAHPTKNVTISETGWPSCGDSQGCAEPGVENQNHFLTKFLCRALKENVSFYLFEAFDEAWKSDAEGPVGACWGLYGSDRRPKHSVTTVLNCPRR
jgi:exo-beta-1,3-glucanase (GH17 family)